MQGTAIGRKLVPRYYCASRRADHSCDQPLIHANVVEERLASSSVTSGPLRRSARRSSAGSPALATAETTETARDTPPWKSACAVPATSMSSVTLCGPSPWPAAMRSTQSWPRRARPGPRPRPGRSGRRGLFDLLAQGEGPRRQAPAPLPHLRARLARRAARCRRPAKGALRALLPATPNRNRRKNGV